MTFKTIARYEFNQLLPDNLILETLMLEQVEWFSSLSGDLLGTIAEGKSVAGWNYAILKRDKKGDFHIRKVMSNFLNLNAARVDLLLSMAGIEKINCADRGTTDFRLSPMRAELSALNPGQQHGQQSKTCSRSVKLSG